MIVTCIEYINKLKGVFNISSINSLGIDVQIIVRIIINGGSSSTVPYEKYEPR